MRAIWIVGAVVAVGIAAFFMFRFANPPNALPPCQPAAGEDSVACSTIDGLWIGRAGSDCTIAPNSCDPLESLALTGLDARYPGHAQITRTRLYDVDMARVCGPILCSISGGIPSIWVFDLADSTRRAIETACLGVGDHCEVLPAPN